MNDGEFEVILNGGLGNQLFGWALGYAASQDSKLSCRFNTSKIEGREFELDSFGILGIAASPFHKIYTHNRIFIRAAMKLLPFFSQRHFVESGFHFQEKFLSPKKHVSYYGYFQSYKYFEKYSNQIRLVLSNLQNPTNSFKSSSKYIRHNRVYAVHIRRGDYIGRESFHGLSSEPYFQKAIDTVKAWEPSAKFILFTDSPHLAKDMLQEVDYIPSITDGLSPAETLILMSQCDGIIGSNSSFSWWAAYLMNPNAVKIFPKPWFTNKSLDTKDLIPPEWIQLDNSESNW